MDTILEEDEDKSLQLVSWSPRGGIKQRHQEEINIPLGDRKRNNNNNSNNNRRQSLPIFKVSDSPALSHGNIRPHSTYIPSINAQEEENNNSCDNINVNNDDNNNNNNYTRNIPRITWQKERRNSEGGESVPVLSKQEFLREMAEREIIETETAYVKDLSICIEEFYLPMKAKEILSKQDMDEIFINIEAIANIHIELEKDLLAHSNIAMTFQKMTPFLRMYSNYCAKGTKALEMLIKHKKNPAVDRFLTQCMTKESVKGQTLESYLIKPTQRLCKYPLLLQTLQENTDKGKPEYEQLGQVVDQIKSVVSVVNETKRQIETIQIIEQLKSQIEGDVESLFSKTSIFLKEGPINLLEETTTTLFFYLFDDLLLAVKPTKRKKKKVAYSFGLDRMLVKDVIKLDDSVPKTTFKLWAYKHEQVISLKLATTLEREKKNWITTLEKAIMAKATQLHDMISNLSYTTVKGAQKISSSSFDDWYLQRKIRLFGEDVVLKQDQRIKQIFEIRSAIQADLDKEKETREHEDAATDVSVQKLILQSYKKEQEQKMALVWQLQSRLSQLEALQKQ